MAEIPKTVATLHCPNGSTVYVIGTAHFSKESVEDVRKTISETRPNVVVLELCKDRQVMLRYSEEAIISEAKNMTFAKMKSFIRRDGFIAGITQSIFLRLSAQLTEQLGVAPGGEFRAGYEEARKVGSQVALGDRLIGITFKRALAALSLWQRIRFTYLLLQSLSSEIEITPEEIEKLKTRDMVTMLTGELASELPALSEVFVTERDQILAYSLMVAANAAHQPYGPPVTVVGVMGMGHIPGIEEHWMKPIQVKELMSVPQPSKTSRVIWGGIKIGLLGLTVAGLYIGIRRLFS